MNRAMLLIAVEGAARLAAREVSGGLPLPRLALPADAGKFLVPYPLSDRPKRRTRLDRLELFGVTDQHHFGAALGSLRNDSLELAAADHTGLVDDQYVALSQPLPALAPRLLPRRQRAALDARLPLQIFRGDSRERPAPDAVTFRLPSVACRRDGSRLPGAGKAGQRLDRLVTGDEANRLLLFGAEITVTLEHRFAGALPHPVRPAVRHLLRPLGHARFDRQHLAGGVALRLDHVAALVLYRRRQPDQLGRSFQPCHQISEAVT